MMIKRPTVIAIVVTMSLAPAARAGDDEQDKKVVQQVFEKYIQSVKTADLALASEVWSHAADVIVVTPFGRFQGWESVRTDLYVSFLQKSFSERNLQPSNVAIGVAGDAAWLTFDWTFTAKSAEGQPIASKGWESHVYRRTPQGWRIVQLHYSVPPPRP